MANLNTGQRYTYDPAAYAKAKLAEEDAAGLRAQRDYALKIRGANTMSPQQSIADWNEANNLGKQTRAAANDPQAEAWQSIKDATLGRGDAVENDPRLTAAMDKVQEYMGTGASSLYSQLTDANAANAGSQAEMLRQQMGQAGIAGNDPAAQARLRQIETARLQGNNSAIGQGQQATLSAASQLAQMRLSQAGLANQSYAQGAGYLAKKDFGDGQNVSMPSFRVPAARAQPQQNQPAARPWTPGTTTAWAEQTGQSNVQTGQSNEQTGQSNVQTPQAKPVQQSAQEAQRQRIQQNLTGNNNNGQGQAVSTYDTPGQIAIQRLKGIMMSPPSYLADEATGNTWE